MPAPDLENRADIARQAVQDAGALAMTFFRQDLKKWDNEAAAMYGVSSIPMSFLIDADGIIVGKNLRGIELHRQIDRFVEKF